MVWGARQLRPEPELTPEQKTQKAIEEKAWELYNEGLPEGAGFYAREAEEVALAHVYKAGIAVGRSVTNVDFGPFIGDGDFFTINGEEYQARQIEESDDPFHGEVIRLVLVKFKEKTDD